MEGLLQAGLADSRLGSKLVQVIISTGPTVSRACYLHLHLLRGDLSLTCCLMMAAATHGTDVYCWLGLVGQAARGDGSGAAVPVRGSGGGGGAQGRVTRSRLPASDQHNDSQHGSRLGSSRGRIHGERRQQQPSQTRLSLITSTTRPRLSHA